MSGPSAEVALLASAVCRVCGERVIGIMAPLHIEDHKSRGEFPDTVTPPAGGRGADPA